MSDPRDGSIMLPVPDDVIEAARRIAPHVNRTPVHSSSRLDRELGASIAFKCESFQKVGAFKARGATHAVLRLDDAAVSRGVLTHSSGNHAAAVAYAGGIRGARATVVMPDGASPIKVAAVRGYGAEIVFCKRAEREAVTARLREERGSAFIHPYENADVIAGQGTAALELLEQVQGLDVIVAPVGGGGLLAGSALAAAARGARVEIWGAEPEAVDDAFRSLTTGVLEPGVPDPRTIADGLMTGLGRPNFEILRAHRARVVTVSEQAIVEAATYLVMHLKLVVEPSAATVLAAIRRASDRLRGARVGAILSGGNTDFSWLAR